MRKLDHIGVVTRHPDHLIHLLVDVLGLRLNSNQEIPQRGIRVSKVQAENITIEVISPINENSEVSRFLEKKGGGLHHICLTSDDIQKDIEKLNDAGVRSIPDSLKKGASGNLVTFFHPKDFEGILLELEEEP